MGNVKMKSGVVVITLTATVYKGRIRKTLSSRVGFCGEYNTKILSELGKHFKEIYYKQTEQECVKKSLIPDKIVCRVSIKSTECEMILNGK